MHVAKKSKPGPDRDGLRALVNTHLDTIQFTSIEGTRMAMKKCPACDRTGHVLGNCTPEMLVKFLTSKGIHVPQSMIG